MRASNCFTFLSVALVLTVPGIFYAAPLDLPPALRHEISAAIGKAADVSVPAANPAAFRQALNKIDAVLTPPLIQAALQMEGEDLEAKLIVLANVLTRQPRHLDEIYKFYVTDGATNSLAERGEGNSSAPKVIRAPQLRPQHATGEFRHAWEFLMLLSWVSESPEDFAPRVEAALVKIGDSRSVPVIERRYKLAARDPRTNPQHFNRLLLKFPSSSALRAMLGCIEEWEERATERKAEKISSIPGLSPTDDSGNPVTADPIPEIRRMKADDRMKAGRWRKVAQAPAEGNAPRTDIQTKVIAAFAAE